MASVIERAIVQLGWEVSPADQKKFADFNKSLDSIISGVGKLAKGLGIVTGALAGAISITNKMTTEVDSLAKSVGVSVGFLQAMGAEAEQIGLNTDNVVDLVEELNNKLGEFKGLKKMTAVSESLKILNLDFKELDKLNPEQQFLKIFDAAKKLGDEQQAVSAVDMLMGGEANKLLGHLRNIEGGMLDIIKRRLELNFLTKEGTEGAVAFTRSLGFITDSAKSMFQQFSGLLGNALLPLLKWTEMWIRTNRKLLQQKLRQWAEALGKMFEWLIPRLSRVVGGVFSFFELIGRVIKRLGGLENVMRLVGAAIAAIGILKAIALIRQFGNAAVTAQLKLFAWIAVIAAIILLLEDLWIFLEDPEADTVFRRLIEAGEEWLGLDLAAPIRDAWPQIKAVFGLLWEDFNNLVALFIENTGNFVMFFVDAFENGIGNAWDHFIERTKNTWMDLWPGLFTFFDSFFIQPISNAFDWISEKVSSLLNTARSAVSSIPLVGSLVGGGAPAAADAAAGGGTSVQQSNSLSISVTAQTGASAQDIGREVRRAAEESWANVARVASTGIER